MIKRLTPKNRRPNGGSWPSDADEGVQLFSPRKAYRKVVVLIDSDLYSRLLGAERGTKDHVLGALLQRDLVRFYRYADEGPPPDVEPVPQHPNCYEDWVVVNHFDAEEPVWGVVFQAQPNSYTQGAVIGNAVEIAEKDVQADAYRDLAAAEAADRRRADGLAGQIADQVLDADLFITERPYVHAATRRTIRGVTLCNVDDAIPILGLYCRAQGEYPVGRNFVYNRGLFFLVGARELLPEGWRWSAACGEQASRTGDTSLRQLSFSLFQRVQDALEARDRVHVALNRPQDHDTQREALAQLDVVLMLLLAAVDVTARVVHRVLGITSPSEFSATWQRTGDNRWLDVVRNEAATLAAVVDPGTANANGLKTLRLLRNSIHGESILGVAFRQGSEPLVNLFELPQADETELLAAMDDTGGRDAWGTKAVLPDRVFVDPGIFVERLFEHIIQLLNDLLATIPFEQRLGMTFTPQDYRPRSETPKGPAEPFDPVRSTHIRWLLGF